MPFIHYPKFTLMKKNLFKKIPITLLSVFLFSGGFVNAQNADIEILRKINISRNVKFDPTFKFISTTVTPVSIGAPLVIYGIGLIKQDSSLKKKGLFIGQSVLVSSFITVALKRTIKRERPFITYSDIENITEASSYAFPSGHTSNAFAAATSISMAFPKWYVIVPTFIWAGSVGYSRMHLGVHYPSDVLAGALVGSGSAYLSFEINKWLNKRYKRNGAK